MNLACVRKVAAMLGVNRRKNIVVFAESHDSRFAPRLDNRKGIRMKPCEHDWEEIKALVDWCMLCGTLRKVKLVGEMQYRYEYIEPKERDYPRPDEDGAL